MFKKNNIWKVFTGLLVLVIGLSVSAFAFPALVTDFNNGLTKKDAPRLPRMGGDQTYLAEALGITIEELEVAQQAASEKALDQTVIEGLLTQEKAEAMKTLGMGLRGFGFMVRGGFEAESNIDYAALLAKELGISVEELQSAGETAGKAAAQTAVENGDLTQEQVDLMKARQALREYSVDRESIVAKVLGISVEELHVTREEGLRMDELLEEYGVTMEDLRVALQTAYEDSVQAALADGAITQSQADLLLSGDFGKGAGGRMNPKGGCNYNNGEPAEGELFSGRGGMRQPGGFGGNLSPNTSSSDL